MKHGDILAVEIAGQEIGDAVVSEITDEHVEVVWRGYAFRLGLGAVEYMDIRNAVDSIG